MTARLRAFWFRQSSRRTSGCVQVFQGSDFTRENEIFMFMCSFGSLGYAFVNFVSAPTAELALQKLQGWVVNFADCAKALKVMPARVQGCGCRWSTVWLVRCVELIQVGMGRDQAFEVARRQTMGLCWVGAGWHSFIFVCVCVLSWCVEFVGNGASECAWLIAWISATCALVTDYGHAWFWRRMLQTYARERATRLAHSACHGRERLKWRVPSTGLARLTMAARAEGRTKGRADKLRRRGSGPTPWERASSPTSWLATPSPRGG